ncbi:MAG: hypothetical protein GX306_00205 [Clostridiales bacterium]|jgi:hypothetical protein|nr:hypothetical protein [Clostridiales bacterium]
MYRDINARMERELQGIYRLQKIEAMLSVLRKEETELENKIAELRVILSKEDLDVTKLENKSLAFIFYSVLGNIDEKIQKEKQEALAAKLKVDQVENESKEIKQRITEYTLEKKQYQDCASNYKKLYDEKKELLMKSDPRIADRLLNLQEGISKAKNNIREIQEAIAKGNQAISLMDKTLRSLDKAEGWGTWDIMGGGLVSNISKHSHLDDAKATAEKVQVTLYEFRTELADIQIYRNIQINTGGFGKFADFFFDGLIADWVMQSRIREAQKSVRNVKGQVEMVILKLIELLNKEESNLEQAEIELENIITKI